MGGKGKKESKREEREKRVGRKRGAEGREKCCVMAVRRMDAPSHNQLFSRHLQRHFYGPLYLTLSGVDPSVTSTF